MLQSLDRSLPDIGIDSDCQAAILKLILSLFTDPGLNTRTFAEAVDYFQNDWRRHLDRVYFGSYEATRWEFTKKYVLPLLPPSGSDRCLDLGCGRGCITAALTEAGVAKEVTGIDGVNFSPEWRERRTHRRLRMNFEHVAVEGIQNWGAARAPFDLIFLFYVLHHSESYFVTRTLDALSSMLTPNGLLVIVEDALT